MAIKENIALSAEDNGRVILPALRSIVVRCVFEGNPKVKFRRKNWSSS